MVDVSIVVITWRMKSFLEILLRSIVEYSTDFNYELIIIDNNSNDGTVEMLEHNYKSTILIKNYNNLGVAPARNQGLHLATGKYVLILDADMELKENSILKLLQFMENNKQCGLVGAKLIYENGDLQFSCKKYPSIFALLGRRLAGIGFIQNSKVLREHLMADWDHAEIADVDYVIGACQLIRRDVIDKIGLYDDKIFYGPEDIDFCIRVWRAGWKVMYFPFTSIIHFEQRITKKTLISKITLKHLLGIYYIFKKYNGKLTRS